MASQQQQQSTDERYISKLDYPFLLLLRIMKILDAMDRGRTAQNETKSLIAILKPSWINKKRKEFDEKAEDRDKILEKFSKNKESMGSTTYYHERNRVFHGYSRWVLQEVIEIMDANKMLLLEEKRVREGGYFEE